jgi:hypothetical protein
VIRPAVAAMYRRRGTLIGWLHGSPPAADLIDPLSGGPIASLGDGPVEGIGLGNFGETYSDPVDVWAYFSKKTSSFSQPGYGVVDIGDAQLDFAVPYVQRSGSFALADAYIPGNLLETLPPGTFNVDISGGIGLQVGDVITIDPGLSTEETVTIQFFTPADPGDNANIGVTLTQPHNSGAAFYVTAPTNPSLTDYNSGNFSAIQNGATIAFDRFVIMGQTWQAKAIPVAITDRNVVVAWRVLVGKVGA